MVIASTALESATYKNKKNTSTPTNYSFGFMFVGLDFPDTGISSAKFNLLIGNYT
jgi:hypothetical protein